MTYNSKSLREIAVVKPLRDCGIEELAVHQITANPSPGVMFARKTEREAKDEARRMVLSLFTPSKFPKGLAILTLPGLEWRFERKLLGQREGNWFKKKGPHRTYLTCIENDRSIYHAALMRMPGIGNPESVIKVLNPTAFAERVVENRWVQRFYFGNVDSMMPVQPVPFDAAWLDYTGPMSIKRLAVIKEFFEKNIRSVLVITALKARWNRETSDEIMKAGGHTSWMLQSLHGEVLHDHEYQDGPSPMIQLALKKV